MDYGMGNLLSVKKKITSLNYHALISSDPDEILNAEKIILPGVGHFKKAMDNIHLLGLFDALNTAVLEKKAPIMGICLGMQLMARHSEEGDAKGFGWLDANVVRFKTDNSLAYKIPHTGWNQVKTKKYSKLMAEIPVNAEFYFMHAYHLEFADNADVLHETTYEYPFISAVEKGNIIGVQYHPEKSHIAGEIMLKNFISMY